VSVNRKDPNVCATVSQCLVIDSVVKKKFCMWQSNALLYHIRQMEQDVL